MSPVTSCDVKRLVRTHEVTLVTGGVLNQPHVFVAQRKHVGIDVTDALKKVSERQSFA